MSAIEGWRCYATICRLCLQKDGFMFGIFNHNQGTDRSIYKKIMDCTALQISMGDGLPNVICHRCLFKIEFCLEFRQLCFMSDATLRQLCITDRNESKLMEKPDFNVIGHLQSTNNTGVVMVVDPNALDYDSEQDSENGFYSDNDNIDLNGVYGTSTISMCKYCDYAFMSKTDCLNHEKTAHNQSMLYNCLECSTIFEDRIQYVTHLKNVHQNEKPYNCPQCDRSFARRSDLRKHTIVHTGIKPYTCHICLKSFSRNTNLSKHMQLHSDQILFSCTKCGKDFTSKSDLAQHNLVEHISRKNFGYKHCDLKFYCKDKFSEHVKIHSDEMANESTTETNITKEEKMIIDLNPFNHNGYDSRIQYEDCYSENVSILKHAESPNLHYLLDNQNQQQEINVNHNSCLSFENKELINTEGELFLCNVCSKEFSSKDNLKYHIKYCHSGTRPHKCNTCNKSFVRKRELNRHIVTHTGMRPFKCLKCLKSFGRKDKLMRHMRIHDVQWEHSCNICGVKFNRRDGLTQHLKIHNRQRHKSK